MTKGATDQLQIGDRTFHRLIIGTGKYRSYERCEQRIVRLKEIVTVAVRRVPLDRSTESFLDYLDPHFNSSNTAGCYSQRTRFEQRVWHGSFTD